MCKIHWFYLFSRFEQNVSDCDARRFVHSQNIAFGAAIWNQVGASGPSWPDVRRSSSPVKMYAFKRFRHR